MSRQTSTVGVAVQELSILADVVRRLEQEAIVYALTGSVAMSCHVVQLGRPDVERIVSLFEVDYYVDRGAVDEAIRLRRPSNVIHYERLIKVDLIVAEPSALLQQRLARRRRLVVEDAEMWVLAEAPQEA